MCATPVGLSTTASYEYWEIAVVVGFRCKNHCLHLRRCRCVYSIHGDRHSERIGHYRRLLSSGRHDDGQVLGAVPGDVLITGRSSSSAERRRCAADQCRPGRRHSRFGQLGGSLAVRRRPVSARPRYTSSSQHMNWTELSWSSPTPLWTAASEYRRQELT